MVFELSLSYLKVLGVQKTNMGKSEGAARRENGNGHQPGREHGERGCMVGGGIGTYPIGKKQHILVQMVWTKRR